MIHDAWVVGSAAQPGAGEVRDYDVLVPWPRWNEAALLVPRDARPNAFGGWKCKDVDDTLGRVFEVDVWPDDLGRFMTCALAAHAWHPRSGSRLAKV
jgi:hypothetical protein